MIVQIAALAVGTVVLARLAGLVRLPPLVGMIVAGALVSALLPAGEGLDLHAIAGELRLAVLALVLLRAGLGLTREDLRHAGSLAVRLGVIPVLFDAALVALAGVGLLGLRWEAAVPLGFLVAAISPAIVIPGMIDLLARREGGHRRVPAALLAGAPIDNLVAVLGLGVALDVALAGDWHAEAWALPYKIGGGVILGLAAGWALARLRAPGWGVWAAGVGMVALGRWLDVSFVIALLTAGFVIRDRAGDALAASLAGYWRWAQYVLFGLIGLAVDVGPLASIGLAALGVVLAGQVGRAFGAWLATARLGLTPREQLGAALGYMPKATIQAAFGGLALDRGLAEGDVLLTVGVLAIAVMAPLGVVAIYRGTDALLPVGEAVPSPGEERLSRAGVAAPSPTGERTG